MTTTPHHVGQVAKAELLIADRLEAWGLSDPNERAAWLVQRLQTELGWQPPHTALDDPPPPPSSSTAEHRAAVLAEARAVIEAKRAARDTSCTIHAQTQPSVHTR